MLSIQENCESVKQFFAKYGEAYEQVFNKDNNEKKEEKEAKKDEGEVEHDEEVEDTHINKILQPRSAVQVSDVKKQLLNDIKEILDVCNKERSQVADISQVLMESKEDKEAENLSTIFLV